jgi:hypothetical protein
LSRFGLRLAFLEKLSFKGLVGWKNYLVVKFVMANSPGDASVVAANCIQ